jgi:RNA polymerase sigma factor (sigma-70 family)
LSGTGSVTLWIEQLKQGSDPAAQALWERYYRRLVALARRKLGDVPRRVADEDDVVASAFQSFCRRAQTGQFPLLTDRDELWSLLVVITTRKALNQARYLQRAKRGGGRPEEQPLLGGSSRSELAEFVGQGPTPEFAADFLETFELFMSSLDDEVHRKIVVWKLEGYTNAEIAEQLDCSVSAVERKLRLIRSRLRAQGVDDEPF